MNLVKLSFSYIKKRPLSTLLNVLILALGIATLIVLLLVSDRMQHNLTRNAEGVDLVVGAKGSPLQLILSAVFHIDAPTGNISIAEAETIMQDPAVAQAIPLALGDAYQGFRIVGTTHAYPAHFGGEPERGRLWEGALEATLGAVAAREAGLEVGSTFYSAHGLGAGGEAHDEHPIEVVGVLAETGTILDRLLLTSIETIWEVHGAHGEDDHPDDDENHNDDDHPHDDENHNDGPHPHNDDHDDSVHDEEAASSQPVARRSGPPGMGPQAPEREYTAVLIRYASPLAAIAFPRFINTETSLQAAAPAYETARLFDLLGVGFDAVRVFGFILVLVAVLSVFVALLNALKDRRYDLAIMRSLGASRRKLMAHVLLEGLLLAGMGTLLGLLLGHLAAAGIGSAVEQTQGLALGGFGFVAEEFIVVMLALGAGILAAIIPAYQAYRTDIARVLATG